MNNSIDDKKLKQGKVKSIKSLLDAAFRFLTNRYNVEGSNAKPRNEGNTRSATDAGFSSRRLLSLERLETRQLLSVSSWGELEGATEIDFERQTECFSNECYSVSGIHLSDYVCGPKTVDFAVFNNQTILNEVDNSELLPWNLNTNLREEGRFSLSPSGSALLDSSFQDSDFLSQSDVDELWNSFDSPADAIQKSDDSIDPSSSLVITHLLFSSGEFTSELLTSDSSVGAVMTSAVSGGASGGDVDVGASYSGGGVFQDGRWLVNEGSVIIISVSGGKQGTWILGYVVNWGD